MERNIRQYFNPEPYQEYLSPFGKKALNVLMRLWQTGRDHNRAVNKRKYFIPIKEKRVLTFNDSHALSTSTQLEKVAIDKTNCDFLEKKLSDVPKCVELIETIHTVEKNHFGENYLAYSDTMPFRLNLVYDGNNTISDGEEPLGHNEDREYNKHINEANNIDWDDMFDSELLPDATANVNLDIKSYLRNETPYEIPTRDQYNTEYNDESNNSNVENSKIKLPKRKKQTKVTDTIPNKVKKIKNDKIFKQVKDINNVVEIKELEPNKIFSASGVNTTKNIFRKQKYTKTVKNWLNDVSPNNPVEEDIIHTENTSNTTAHIETNKLDDYISTTATTAKPKKVVQSQLANKDGVMKFSKPKQPTETNKPINESKIVEKNILKEKKVKKFIAPIKSQIPVKDVVFEVCNVEASNIDEYKLLDVKDNEILVTLIYSNGFSQLNSQHTDDTCVPDGIILSNDEIFYSFNANTNPRIEEILNHLFENNKIICYDGKAILVYVATQFKIEMDSPHIYDAQIGCSLLEPDNPPENFAELQKVLAFSPQYTVAAECRLQKAAWYLTLLRECWARLSRLLVQDSLWSVFVDIETRLLPIVANMELRGVKIDVERLKCMEQILMTKMKQVEQECYGAAGKVFQINSAVQVRAIIYDELRLDAKCNVKIRETLCKGAKSTSETMLRSLVSQHPLPKLILEYRHLHKAHATFLAGIAHHVTHGLVRPTWVQTAAATGRIASNNPNLQAIPKAPFSLVMFLESDEKDCEQLNFRSIYIARAGHVLLAADFKHVECRVFAHAAADTSLLDALKSKDDLFRVLAGKWLNKSEAAVSCLDRERTKRIVYASLYGAGTRKLMDILGVNYEQALAVVASFNRTFPSLKSFGRGVVARCQQGAGRLATLCGRARRFTNIASGDFALRSQAERQAVNFVVQGSAADLCKTAMILTVAELRASSPPVRAHLLLQLHDELVWEVDQCHLERAAVLIKRVMEECGRGCGMSVPLPVALSAGASWGDMADFTPR